MVTWDDERERQVPRRGNELATQLASLPGVVDALLAAHAPDQHGRCRGCTTGGTGTPGGRWPCTLQAVAALARTARDR